MLHIEHVRMRLPAGFEHRASSIARLLGESMSAFHPTESRTLGRRTTTTSASAPGSGSTRKAASSTRCPFTTCYRTTWTHILAASSRSVPVSRARRRSNRNDLVDSGRVRARRSIGHHAIGHQRSCFVEFAGHQCIHVRREGLDVPVVVGVGNGLRLRAAHSSQSINQCRVGQTSYC